MKDEGGIMKTMTGRFILHPSSFILGQAEEAQQ
jgi:hypothetical protein